MKKQQKSKRVGGVRAALETIRDRVAGIDIGSKEHWVCGPPRADGQPNVRSFGTTTSQLEALRDWLKEEGVESVAMESTSVYWIPLFELLEASGIEVLLVNARQLHNVPGRKTDVSDCQWLQILHAHGLLRGSFRPADAIAQLRALQRQRGNFVEERTRCVQWMQKALDQMNVQVHRAVSDLTGETGMTIVRAIVAGERDAMRLAAHRDSRCRKTAEEIADHLRGNWREEHLFNLKTSLDMYDTLQKTIEAYDERVLQAMAKLQPPDRRDAPVPPHPNPRKDRQIRKLKQESLRTALWRFGGSDLCRIDGISVGTARTILSEIGADLSAFPDEDHFVSWLRLCPRVPISGGKPLKKRRNGLGATRVASALRMAASALQRSKSALGAAYRRIARNKGATVALFAMARKLAQLVFRMLRYGQDYIDAGEEAFEAQYLQRRLAGLKNAAASLGYTLAAVDPPQVAP